MFQQHQDESLCNAWNHFKDLLRKVPHHGLDLWLQVQIFYDHVNYTTQMAIDYAAGGWLRKLRLEEAWETIENLAQYKEEEWNEPIFSKKGSPGYIDANLEQELESIERREEFEGQNTELIDDQEDQLAISGSMRNIKDTFMSIADSLLATMKENKLEYKDEDEVDIKMMGTGMDKESLEHNLYKDNMTLIICHNFSPTSNPPIKPKDSGNFRMKVIFDEKKLGSS
ncbi:hypothetical protein Tco_0755522 [Tanacetum coccineum]